MQLVLASNNLKKLSELRAGAHEFRAHPRDERTLARAAGGQVAHRGHRHADARDLEPAHAHAAVEPRVPQRHAQSVHPRRAPCERRKRLRKRRGTACARPAG